MTDLKRLNGEFLVGLPVTLADGSPFVVLATVAVGADGNPVDSAGMATAIGNTDDAAWNGTDPNASVIALLKAIAANTATT